MLLAVGVLVAALGLVLPVSGSPSGSAEDVACGSAGGTVFGDIDDGDAVIMTGTDTAITKQAWCDSEAHLVLGRTSTAAAALLILGAAAWGAPLVRHRLQRQSGRSIQL